MDEQTSRDGEKVEEIIKTETKPEKVSIKRKSKKTKKDSNKSRKTDKKTKKVDKPDAKPMPILEEEFKKRAFYLKKRMAFCPNEQLKESYKNQLDKLMKRPIISF